MIDAPAPRLGGADDVLVRTGLTPVNPADAWLLSGGLVTASARPPLWAGIEIAGTVEAVGDAADDLQVGDLVLAGSSFLPRGRGTHAEQVVLTHRYRMSLPPGTDLARFAGLPVAAGAALHALDLARPRAGELIAVTGAAGAVGRMVVQLAVRAGVRVVGIGRAHDSEDILALGCETFVDGSDLPATWAADVGTVVDAAALGVATTSLVRAGGTVVALRPFVSDRIEVTVVPTSVAALLADPGILSRAVQAVVDDVLAVPPLESFAATELQAALDRLAEPGRHGSRPVLVW